jgi:hypothetical protein
VIVLYVYLKLVIGLELDTKLSSSKHRIHTPKMVLPIREKVYNYLKSAILSGNFDPGEKLTEEHLAPKMKVSRSPGGICTEVHLRKDFRENPEPTQRVY